MGYFRHHAIVVTTPLDDDARVAHAEAVRTFEGTGAPGAQVTPLLRPTLNDYVSFAVLPDGSKEGWTESDDGDTARDAFVAYLASRHLSWVEVQFGDENGEQIVTRASGMARDA
jgi:hypothetical protein